MATDNHRERLLVAKQESAARKKAVPAAPIESFWSISEEEESKFMINDGRELFQTLKSKIEEKGQLLYGSLMGSKRYNLHIATSDLDFVLVYLPPISAVVGMEPSPGTIKQLDNLRPDFQIHRLEHYCHLLAEGDAKSVELLYVDPNIEYYADPTWRQLVAMRDEFVTKTFVRNYLTELQGAKGLKKLERLVQPMPKQTASDMPTEERAQVAKCLYILFRLVRLANRFIQGFEDNSLSTVSPIWFETASDDRNMLLDIRSGLNIENGVDDLKEAVAALTKRLESCSLPDIVPSHTMKLLDQWYLTLRRPYSDQSDPVNTHYSLGFKIDGLEPFLRSLPGQLLYLTHQKLENSIFGVYSRHLPDKLRLFHETSATAVLSTSLQTSDGPVPITIYEMDRLTDAINRTELTTFVSILSDSSQTLWTSPSWLPIHENGFSALCTHTLLYQACGFVSGKFKECKSNTDLIANRAQGFASGNVIGKLAFAISLFSFALSDSAPRLAPSGSLSDLSKLLDMLKRFYATSLAIHEQRASQEDIKKLAGEGPAFTQLFISLRPVFAQLLRNEIDKSIVYPWFIQCRLGPSSNT